MTKKPEIVNSLTQLHEACLLARNLYELEAKDAFRDVLTDIQLLVDHIKKNVDESENEKVPANAFEVEWHKLAKQVHSDNVRKGFWPKDVQERSASEAIALMHSELSEALEAYRHFDPDSTKIPGFSQAEEEFADVVIRLMDFTAGCRLRIPEAMAAKLEYNRNRPPKHGKDF